MPGFATVVAVISIVGSLMSAPAAAQTGWWPWATPSAPQQRPPPREPAPPPRAPQPSGPGGFAPGAYAPQGQRSAICLQLEQRLVQETQRGGGARDQLPRLETDIRQAERALRTAEAALDRSDCYEQWFFTRSLRRTRQCVDLANQVDTTKRRMSELDAQRQQLLGSRGRSYQDDIIRELARNNCGANYQAEAQRRGNNPFSSLWQDEEAAPTSRNEFGKLPFATYRTICVRLCDGYYFPISFSTLENHFARDADACQSKCAAPAELYYYQNPGGSVEQAVSAGGRQPYTSLRSAFRYRKEYVQGCSCKQAEYTPSPGDRGDRKADAPVRTPAPPPRQALR